MNAPAPRFFVPALVALALGTAAAPAHAVTDNFCKFSSTSGFDLNGNAYKPPFTDSIRLTTYLFNNQRGSAFVATPVPLTPTTSFHAFFRFHLGPDSGGGDGLVFVLQSSGGSGALGGNGSALGYAGITQSVAVEFDTYKNGWDTNGNHVALLFDGDTHTHVAGGTPGFTLANDKTTYAWIDYDGASKQLAVSVAQSANKPAAPLFTATADLSQHLGAQAWAGFTAASGGATNTQEVYEFELSTDGQPCCTSSPGGACSAPLPACGPGGLCVECVTNGNCTTPPAVKCDTTVHDCVECLSSDDCGGTTPVCNTTTHACQPCASDADCTAAAPACQPNGSCGQCSATNTTQCLPPQAMCDVATGTCVSCQSNADCAGTKPICDATTHVCQPCASDADCAGNPGGPACVTMGASQGACVACTSDASCAAPTPKCDTAANKCGCSADADCGAGSVCDKSQLTSGQCAMGCHVINGTDSCGAGLMCDKQDGSVGACQPVSTSSSSSGGAGGAMSSSSGTGGAMSSGTGGAMSSGTGGAMSSGTGGAGGASSSSSGSSSSSDGSTSSGTGGAMSSGAGGAMGAGGATAAGGAGSAGIVSVGGGCWCGVGAGGEADPKAIAAAALLAAAIAGRRRRRA